MINKKLTLLFVSFIYATQLYSQISLSVGGATFGRDATGFNKPTIKTYHVQTGSYSVVDEDPQNIPQLIFNIGGFINVGNPSLYGLSLGAKFRKDELGEFTANYNMPLENLIYGPSAETPIPATNYVTEFTFFKYLNTQIKEKRERIALNSFQGRGFRTTVNLYTVIPIPVTISIGARAGLNVSAGSMSFGNTAVNQFSQLTGSIGFARTKMVRTVIDFTDLGICGSTRTTTLFADILFAPMQKEQSIMTVRDEDTFQDVSSITHPTKIPLGLRVGVTKYRGSLRGRGGYSSTIELGYKPTFGTRNNGLYLMWGYSLYFGFKHNTPKYGHSNSGYTGKYDNDWYEAQIKKDRENRKKKRVLTFPKRLSSEDQKAEIKKVQDEADALAAAEDEANKKAGKKVIKKAKRKVPAKKSSKKKSSSKKKKSSSKKSSSKKKSSSSKSKTLPKKKTNGARANTYGR